MTSSTRHKSSVALVLIDVINHFEFLDSARVLANALPMAPRLAKLKSRCRRAGIPAIYINDNFGQWRSDANSMVQHCLESRCPGKPFVEQIRRTIRIISCSSRCIRRSSRRRWRSCCAISALPR